MSSVMDLAVSALGAFSTGMQVTANNIANVSTDRFKSSRVDYATGPQGFGVQAGNISYDLSPGPLQLDYAYLEGKPPVREGSNTQLEREFSTMIVTENAYSANATVVRAADQMAGTLLDMVI